ncbi:MAG TPA: hypothetical protein VFH63_01720 [candidate division Zixibacteria bacterium]|nr:hypothetical protein [candidate division Zixibacteria bacterium]
MPIPDLAGARPSARILAGMAVAIAVLLTACSSTESPSLPSSIRPSASSAPTATPGPTPTPAPTPPPTPTYTNPPDPELQSLFPDQVAGATLTVPDPSEFAMTPGDFGEAYGELGLRFRALQVAYVPRPRSLAVYVARVEGGGVETRDLEPYLATAGQYVGIAGLVREAWELQTIDGRLVWVRPEDNATAAGTMIYTWAADDLVFLMIGTDDELNRALFAALPGEAAPTPRPSPTRPAASGSGRSSASPAPSASAAPS